MSEPLYPLRFVPHLVRKPWGGQRLASALGRTQAQASPEGSEPFGESWEITDLPGAESVVADGPLAGRTIHELAARFPDRVLGQSADAIAPDGRFPVMVKYLDVRDRLSLQVHPSDPAARDVGAVRGKSEMWWVLAREPGAFVLLGPRGPTDRERFAASLERGEGEDELVRHEPEPGDVVCLPAGAVHSAGGGLLLLEIQDACDITYRLHDWGRTDRAGSSRPLHREEALGVLRAEGIPEGLHVPAAEVGEAPLRTRRFSLKVAAGGGGEALVKTRPEPRLAIVLDGEGSLRPEAGDGHEAPFALGDVFLFPAGLGPHRFVGSAERPLRVLLVCIGPRDPAPWDADARPA